LNLEVKLIAFEECKQQTEEANNDLWTQYGDVT